MGVEPDLRDSYENDMMNLYGSTLKTQSNHRMVVERPCFVFLRKDLPFSPFGSWTRRKHKRGGRGTPIDETSCPRPDTTDGLPLGTNLITGRPKTREKRKGWEFV